MVPRPLHVVPNAMPRPTGEVDDATLRACQGGDPEAQRAFVVRYQAPVFALVSRLLGHGSDVEDLAARRLRDALLAAIDGLSFEQRAVIVMTEFHGLGVAEVARCLELNENTVKTRLFRARAHLSVALAAHRGADD